MIPSNALYTDSLHYYYKNYYKTITKTELLQKQNQNLKIIMGKEAISNRES